MIRLCEIPVFPTPWGAWVSFGGDCHPDRYYPESLVKPDGRGGFQVSFIQQLPDDLPEGSIVTVTNDPGEPI
jgi:hypothetical protein